MPWFLIDSTGYRYPIDEPGLSLGRAADNDVMLIDEETSRHHAYIQPHAGRIWLYDRGSSNGVFIGEQRIEDPTLLRHGDIIRLGHTLLRVEAVEIPSMVPPPAVETTTSTPMQTWQAIVIGALIGLMGLAIVFVIVFRPALASIQRPSATPGSYGIYTEALRSTAFILAPIQDTPTSVGGTGVVIADGGRLLTAYSAVYDPNSGQPYNRNSQVLVGLTPSGQYQGQPPAVWYLARVVRADRQRDLAVLQIFAMADGSPLPNSFRLPPVPLAENKILAGGDPISIISFVGGGVGDQSEDVGRILVLGEGQVIGYLPDAILNSDTGWIQTDIGLTLSNVGGLALDQQGRLVGLYTGARSEDSGTQASLLRPYASADPLLRGWR